MISLIKGDLKWYHNYSLEGEQLDLFQDYGVHLSIEGNLIFVSSLRQMVEFCLFMGDVNF